MHAPASKFFSTPEAAELDDECAARDIRTDRFNDQACGTRKESLHHNAIELLYGDRIAFIDLNTEKGSIIENKTLVEFQKTIFLALYKRL